MQIKTLLKKWRKRLRLKPSQNSKQPQKPKPKQKIKHPDSEHELEVALEVEGEKFYRFKDVNRYTSLARWYEVQEYLQCLRYRVTPDLRDEYFAWLQGQVQRIASENNPKERLKKSSDTVLAIRQYMSRIEYFPDTEILLNIAARLYFKIDDDLASGLDEKELKRRVNLLKKKDIMILLSEPLLMTTIGLQAQHSQSSQELIREMNESRIHLESLRQYMREAR